MKKKTVIPNLIGTILLSVGLLVILFAAAVDTTAAVTRIMPLGDSITRGGGSSGQTGYRRPLYFMLENAHYDVKFTGSLVNGDPPDFDRDHEGHGSYRADQVRDYVYSWLTAHPADIVLLHIGINDIAGGNEDVNEVADILKNIDRWENDNATPVTVIVARIVLRWDGNDPETIAFNDAVEAMVQQRIADGDNLIMVDMEHALNYPDDLYDGVHPNDVGYAKMAQVWDDALTAILPPPVVPTSNVEVSDVALTATTLQNSTDDDLFCTYTLGGEATTAAITWFKDGSPLLSLYLPFEGGSSNGLLDLSGHDHSVTAQGSAIAAWRGTMGHDGHGAFMFDPSFWLNAGEVFPVSSSYTKTAWVYMTGTGASNNILSSQDVTGGHVLYASQSQGNRLSAGQLGDWNLVQDPTPLVTDQWYFVGVSFDYATGMMILYKDGVVVDTATVPPGERDITDQTLLVGTFSTGGGNGWLGLIDEARLYDYVLTPEQILALSHSADTITSTETEVDEVWQAEVTPFSASDLGSAIASNTLVIGQPTPWLSNVELHASSPDNTSADDLISEYSLGGDCDHGRGCLV